MGFWDSIKQFNQQGIARVASVLNPFDSSPISVVNPFNQQQSTPVPFAKNAVRVLEAADVAAFGGAAAISLGGGTLASTAKVGLTAVKDNFGKVAVAAVTSPVILGAYSSNPQGFKNAVKDAPANLYDFGKQGATVAQNPSVQGAKNLISSHPFISGAAAGAIVLATGQTVSHLLDSGSRTINSLEIAGNTSALKQLAANPIQQIPYPMQQTQQTQVSPVVKVRKKKKSTSKKKKRKKYIRKKKKR